MNAIGTSLATGALLFQRTIARREKLVLVHDSAFVRDERRVLDAGHSG